MYYLVYKAWKVNGMAIVTGSLDIVPPATTALAILYANVAWAKIVQDTWGHVRGQLLTPLSYHKHNKKKCLGAQLFNLFKCILILWSSRMLTICICVSGWVVLSVCLTVCLQVPGS